MLLERRKAGHRLAPNLERGHAVGDALFGLGHDFENRRPQRLERASLGLVEGREVAVNFSCRHGGSLPPDSATGGLPSFVTSLMKDGYDRRRAEHSCEDL